VDHRCDICPFAREVHAEDAQRRTGTVARFVRVRQQVERYGGCEWTAPALEQQVLFCSDTAEGSADVHLPPRAVKRDNGS
jgi:hypothetical protein